jgi:hypothetical protein
MYLKPSAELRIQSGLDFRYWQILLQKSAAADWLSAT